MCYLEMLWLQVSEAKQWGRSASSKLGVMRHLSSKGDAENPIGAKPNFYCKAIELVCGGSPRICVLVEWKALDRVKSEL